MRAARTTLLFGGLAGIALLAMLVALACGSADISAADTVQAIFGAGPENTRSLILELRLPRA